MSHLFCPQCGSENDATAYLCQSCGYDFIGGSILVCPICQFENQPEAEQCKQCGTDLTAVLAVGEVDQEDSSPGSARDGKPDTGHFTDSFLSAGRSADDPAQSDDFEDWLTEVVSEDLEFRSKIEGDAPSDASPSWAVDESELSADTRELDGEALPEWLKNLDRVDDVVEQAPQEPTRRKLPEWLHESKLAEIGRTKDLEGEESLQQPTDREEGDVQGDQRPKTVRSPAGKAARSTGTAPISRQSKADEEEREERKPDSWLLELAAMGTATKAVKGPEEEEETRFVWDDSALVSDIDGDLGDDAPDWLNELTQSDDWPDTISEQVIEEWTRKIVENEDDDDDSDAAKPYVTQPLGHTKELSGVPERLVSQKLPVWLGDQEDDQLRKEDDRSAEKEEQIEAAVVPKAPDQDEVPDDGESLPIPDGEYDDSFLEFMEWPDDDLSIEDTQEVELRGLPIYRPGDRSQEEAAEPSSAESLPSEIESQDIALDDIEPIEEIESEEPADIKPAVVAAVVSQIVETDSSEIEPVELSPPGIGPVGVDSAQLAESEESEVLEPDSDSWLEELADAVEEDQPEEKESVIPEEEPAAVSEIAEEIDSDVPKWLARLTSKLLDTFDNEFVSEWFSRDEIVETSAEIDLQDDVEPLTADDFQDDQIDPFYGEAIPDWVRQADSQASGAETRDVDEGLSDIKMEPAAPVWEEEIEPVADHETELEALIAAGAVAGADGWLDLLEDDEGEEESVTDHGEGVGEEEDLEELEEQVEVASTIADTATEGEEFPVIPVHEALDIPDGDPQQPTELGTAIADEYLIPDLNSQDSSIPFSMSREQRQQVVLLQQLTSGEIRASKPVEKVESTALRPDFRLLIASLLLILIIIGWFLPSSLNPFTQMYQPAILGSEEEVYEAVQSAAGRPILVAFEYTPAMAGEMNIVALTLLNQIAANNSSVIAMSQVAAGTAIAKELLAEVEGLESQNLGYIPGDSVGLRKLAICINEGDSCESIYGQTLGEDVVDQLENVKLALVLSSERDPIVDWVEQFSPVVDIDLITGVIQPLGPIIDPYVNSEQINGAIVGAQSAAAYQLELLGTEAGDNDSLGASALGLWFAIVVLIAGSLYFGLFSRRKAQLKQEIEA